MFPQPLLDLAMATRPTNPLGVVGTKEEIAVMWGEGAVLWQVRAASAGSL